ncbi:hypothetical protein BA953_24085 [Vibrio coralliilyticus]|uniref:winged helix-turn-helix domain-containing protein n=1 Tax=Vibrio coralliilyticus TaxID=190893 RepID=UPI0008108B0F|nr:winged helix-turn-helix domain-containing protein [Vibrio coralliilyticus]ANW27200.1 hypothetical protein BA953_24085 [Vibrio coralliilyticus]
MSDRSYIINDRYVLNVSEHTIMDIVTGIKITIGSNASSLMLYMISNPSKVITKSTLVKEVWEKKGLIVEQSSVLTCVSLCRKYLNDKEGNIIRTVRGVGYEFRAISRVYDQKDFGDKKPNNKKSFISNISNGTDKLIRKIACYFLYLIFIYLIFSFLLDKFYHRLVYKNSPLVEYSECRVLNRNIILRDVKAYRVDDTWVFIGDNGISLSVRYESDEVYCE